MTKAVRFDSYGPIENLYVADVELPEPAEGEVQVRVKAAGINPGEASIRKGLMAASAPSSFPVRTGQRLRRCGRQAGARRERRRRG